MTRYTLPILAHLSAGPDYAAAVSRAIGHHAWRPLQDLDDAGLVAVAWTEGGRPYYRITPSGSDTLRRARIAQAESEARAATDARVEAAKREARALALRARHVVGYSAEQRERLRAMAERVSA